MQGQCLCGAVAFSIQGELPDFYQCHCSLCRKVTGSSHSTGTLIPRSHFKWLKGEPLIHSYQHPNGYRNHNCAHCGCPVPNPVLNSDYMWIPVGSLDATHQSRVVQHIYTASRASWDTSCDALESSAENEVRCFSEMVDFDEFYRWLYRRVEQN